MFLAFYFSSNFFTLFSFPFFLFQLRKENLRMSFSRVTHHLSKQVSHQHMFPILQHSSADTHVSSSTLCCTVVWGTIPICQLATMHYIPYSCYQCTTVQINLVLYLLDHLQTRVRVSSLQDLYRSYRLYSCYNF